MPEYPFNILIVDDEEIVHLTLGEYLKDLGHTIVNAYDGRSGLAEVEKNDFAVALVDIRMPAIDGLTMIKQAQKIAPETSFVIITGHADMETAIEALRRDAADFLVKPVKLEELDAVLAKAFRLRKLRQQDRHLRDTIRGIQHPSRSGEASWEFIGKSRAAEKARYQIGEAAQAGCDTVLVTGETGTGKEVVARSIHLAAAGGASPFIAVNCPAIPDNLMESELFGHQKGAFTGATEDRAGAFELADEGTLFLDEIGDLTPASQAALLRVLENRTFRRIGGSKDIKVSLRVIAATNQDLEKAVEQGLFRRDLFYRLNIYHIHIPPLRERKEDIMPLAGHFLSMIEQQRRCRYRGFAPKAGELLNRHDFPGNARELRNIIERACIVCRSRGENGPIDVGYLDHLIPREKSSSGNRPSPEQDDERTRLLDALESCKWNRREAARQLKIPYSTLRYKIQKLGLNR